MVKIIRFLLTLMIITSFITHTIDIDSSNFVIARMTFSDVFGLLAISLFCVEIINDRDLLKQIPFSYTLGLLMIGCFLLTAVTSLSLKSTIAEILILSYLLLLSFTVFVVFKNMVREWLFPVLIATTSILSMIGIYDVIASNMDYPTIFTSANKQHGVSGFRYFGQAAHYIFIMLTILIPLKYSNLSKDFSSLKKTTLNLTIVLGSLFLVSTGRVSIIISFSIGLLIFVIVSREKRIIKDFSYSFLSLIAFIFFINKLAPTLYGNIIYRIQSRVSQREVSTPEASFIIENFNDSLQAFSDNIWFGTGLGGFVNNYSNVEIHGTYLKIIGETGLIGLFGYVLFFGYFTYIILKNSKSKSTNFFVYYIPFFLASLVAWSYNYHVRKKEFWLLFALLIILDSLKSNPKTITSND